MFVIGLLLFDYEIRKILFDVALGHCHELVSGIIFAKASDFFELFLSLRTNGANLIFELFDLVFLLAKILRLFVDLVELRIEQGFAFGETIFGALPFFATLCLFALRFFVNIGCFFFGIQDNFRSLMFCLADKVVGLVFTAVFVVFVVCKKPTSPCTCANNQRNNYWDKIHNSSLFYE